MGMCMDGFMFGSCCAKKQSQNEEGLAHAHTTDTAHGAGHNSGLSSSHQFLNSYKDPEKSSSHKSKPKHPLMFTPELSATSVVLNTYQLTQPPVGDSSGSSSSHVIISKVPLQTNLYTTHRTTTSTPAPIPAPSVVPGVYLVKPPDDNTPLNRPSKYPTEPLHSAPLAPGEKVEPVSGASTLTPSKDPTTETYWSRPGPQVVITPPVPPSRPTRPPKPQK